jgi:hypothetical protein
LKFKYNRDLETLEIWQGQFKQNKLEGFGRKMSIYYSGKDAETACYIGWFKEGKRHGWVKHIYCSGETQEDLYQDGHRMPDHDEILQYDLKYNKIAKPVDVTNYIIKPKDIRIYKKKCTIGT